jgi:hypothetical protein
VITWVDSGIHVHVSAVGIGDEFKRHAPGEVDALFLVDVFGAVVRREDLDQ